MKLSARALLGLLLALIDVATAAIEQSDVPDPAVDPGDLAAAYLGVYWHHAIPLPGQSEALRQLASSNREHFGVGRSQMLRRELEDVTSNKAALNSWSESRRILERSSPQLLSKTIEEVIGQLWRNPVRRLQLYGDEEWRFLYDWSASPRSLTFIPGGLETLLTYGPVLRPIIERRFALIVEMLNPQAGGRHLADTIYGHLFMDSERVMPNLDGRQGLMELQSGRCLWTDDPIKPQSPADHVVPWVRRPISSIENFVLSTTAANSSKGAFLLSPRLLERWLGWLEEHRHQLRELAPVASLVSDSLAVLRGFAGSYRLHPTGVPMWDGPKLSFTPILAMRSAA